MMKDSMRESLSYGGLFWRMLRVKRAFEPQRVPFGENGQQYFLYYEPRSAVSDKVIMWIHGGGWNAGTPKMFDFVGQCVAKNGYRFVSIGYRLSPAHRYPCQFEDVCVGYRTAVDFLSERGIDAENIIVAGSSAGAHLAAILCCSKGAQERYGVDVSKIIGFIGMGGPYCFSGAQALSVRLLLKQLFSKGYDRSMGEPYALMEKRSIPMLLIHSRHDGLIEFSCAERFCEKARRLGNRCELYEVEDRRNTHSWYTAGMFLEAREGNRCLERFFSWIENLPETGA